MDRWGVRLRGVVLLQIGAGFLNLLLLAPTWMQVVHLLLADLLWISLTLFAAAALACEPVPRSAAATLRSGAGTGAGAGAG
jgi:heme A synthase